LNIFIYLKANFNHIDRITDFNYIKESGY
jgi:hypothetical protein